MSLTDLAGIYALRVKLAQAESRYRRALEIRERAFGSQDLRVATSLHTLAYFYANQGRLGRG